MTHDPATAAANRIDLTVAAEEAGDRLDRVLAARLPEFSRSRLKALIVAGAVTIDGATVVDPAHRGQFGGTARHRGAAADRPDAGARNHPLTIVYEDSDLLVIDKPAGLVVHPAAGNAAGTLVNALIAHCGDSLSGIGGVKRPGIVHRLDKDTSGLLVVAKNDRAHRKLSAQFADHGRTGALKRSYFAFVWGVPGVPSTGTRRCPPRPRPAREREDRGAGGRPRGHHPLEQGRDLRRDRRRPVASLLECRLETGRTHQIRVHMAHIGHPLLGDAVYGAGFRTKVTLLGPAARAALLELDRQALHAATLAFAHPSKGTIVAFSSELPKDLAKLRRALEQPDETVI